MAATMKRPPDEDELTINKRPRLGVGTAVAELVRGPADDFVLLLTKIGAERLRPKGLNVISIGRLEVLPVLCQRLLENNVLSLPVVNQEGKFYGFVDQRDVVTFISNMFSDFETVQLLDVQQAFNSEQRFQRAVVADIMRNPRRKRNPYFPLRRGTSLYTAWETLLLESLHRIPILDENEKIADVITQSMLIDFLWQNIEKFGDYFLRKKVGDLQLRNEVVFSTQETARAIVAFRHMVAMGVYGLAVVDASGRLVDNLSLRDLKRAYADASMFWMLWDNVKSFKENMRRETPQTTATTQTSQGPLCVVSSDTLYTVVEKMALNHVHRLYEVQDLIWMKPLGVISQTDILNLVLHPI